MSSYKSDEHNTALLQVTSVKFLLLSINIQWDITVDVGLVCCNAEWASG
jgi:hypothetical protein